MKECQFACTTFVLSTIPTGVPSMVVDSDPESRISSSFLTAGDESRRPRLPPTLGSVAIISTRDSKKLLAFRHLVIVCDTSGIECVMGNIFPAFCGRRQRCCGGNIFLALRGRRGKSPGSQSRPGRQIRGQIRDVRSGTLDPGCQIRGVRSGASENLPSLHL